MKPYSQLIEEIVDTILTEENINESPLVTVARLSAEDADKRAKQLRDQRVAGVKPAIHPEDAERMRKGVTDRLGFLQRAIETGHVETKSGKKPIGSRIKELFRKEVNQLQAHLERLGPTPKTVTDSPEKMAARAMMDKLFVN